MEKKFYFKQLQSGLLDEFGREMTKDLTVLESELTDAQMHILRGELTRVYNQMPTAVQTWFKELLLVKDPAMACAVDSLQLPDVIKDMIKGEMVNDDLAQ